MKTLVKISLVLAAGWAGTANVSADFSGHFALPTDEHDAYTVAAGGSPVAVGDWTLSGTPTKARIQMSPGGGDESTAFSLTARNPAGITTAALQIEALAPTTLSFGWLSTVDHAGDKVSYFINSAEHVLASGDLGFVSGSVLNLALGIGDTLKFFVQAQDNAQTLQVQSFSTVTTVPEPGQVAGSLLVLGLAGYGYRRYRSHQAA